MSTEGASLVAGAKQWASYYGDFPNGVEGAVLTAPLRCRAAWDANDAEGFASSSSTTAACSSATTS